VSRRMGLFVVARLAARHGIRVRLRPAASRGLVALVWLPDEAITHQEPGITASPGGSEPAMAMPGIVARPVAEAIVTPEPGPSPRWATTGPLPGFRTVPRPAEEPEYAPGQTGPNPIVGWDEEPFAERGDESADADPPIRVGTDSQATAFLPFGTGEADYRSGSRAGDVPDGPNADPWVNAAVAPPAPPAPPPAEPFYVRNRLPVFEAVESDWFRQDVTAVARFAHDSKTVPGISGWSSPADEGWRAAATVQQPSSAGVTPAGLPKRVPRANLVPGAASASEARAPTVSARSAAETRDRFASFQRGARRGRAAAEGEEAGGGDDPGNA
jgi:hypothetical protein